jgi:hypothetical protein
VGRSRQNLVAPRNARLKELTRPRYRDWNKGRKTVTSGSVTLLVADDAVAGGSAATSRLGGMREPMSVRHTGSAFAAMALPAKTLALAMGIRHLRRLRNPMSKLPGETGGARLGDVQVVTGVAENDPRRCLARAARY